MKTVLLLCCILLVGCVHVEEQSNRVIIEQFPIEEEIILDSCEVEPVLFFLGDMLINNDMLITMDLKNDVFFQYFKLPNLSYLGSSTLKGGGPDDEIMILPNLQTVTDSTWTFRTLSHQKVVYYDLIENRLQLLEAMKVPNEYSMVMNSFLLKDIILGYDLLGENDKEYIACDLKSGEVEDFGEDFPKVSFSVKTKTPNMLYSKIMSAKNDCSSFAALYDKFPLLRIYDKEGSVLSEVEFRNNQRNPLCYATDYSSNKDYLNTTINYMKIKTTDRYIYGLYSGKTHLELSTSSTDMSDYCSEVHVWDWSGNPIKRFVLDKPVGCFAVSPDDSFMIFYSYNRDNMLYKLSM